MILPLGCLDDQFKCIMQVLTFGPSQYCASNDVSPVAPSYYSTLRGEVMVTRPNRTSLIYHLTSAIRFSRIVTMDAREIESREFFTTAT